jgi:hypothetical protein
MGPPHKRKARPAYRQNALALTQSSAANNGTHRAIAQFRKEQEGEQDHVFLGWKRQAERLLQEFWLTGKMSHLGAFVVHVVAMRRRMATLSLTGDPMISRAAMRRRLMLRRATSERRNA